MSTFDDLSTDGGKLRWFLNDRDSEAPFFSDPDLEGLRFEANSFVVPLTDLPAAALYYAAHIGWLIKAGLRADESKKQKIVVLMKDTHVTYLDAVAQAHQYLMLSKRASASSLDGGIGVAVPTLDTHTPRLDTDCNPFIRHRDLLEEIF